MRTLKIMSAFEKRSVLLVAICMFAVPAVQAADIIADYSFTDTADLASVDSQSNSVASTFGWGPAGTNWGRSVTYDNVYAKSDTAPNSETNALVDGSYFKFTMTSDPGRLLYLDSLNFDTAYTRVTTALSLGVKAYYFVRSSLDGFAANIGDTFEETYQAVADGVFTPRTVSLTNSLFQGVSGSVEFRIYVYDESTNPERAPRIDNVVLQGDHRLRGTVISIR